MKTKDKEISKLLSAKNRSNTENGHDTSSSGYFSAKMLKPSTFPRTVAYWCYGILGLVIITMFLPWTQNIRSYGYVTTFEPENRPQTIHSAIAGRVDAWHVNEGEFVARGDTILELSEIKDEYLDPAVLVRIEEQVEAKTNSLEATQTKAEALRNQIAALRQGLTLSLEKAENKIQQSEEKLESERADYAAAQTAFEIAQAQAERYESLFESGLVSEQELENYQLKLQENRQKLVSAENKVTIARADLVNARIELNSTRAEYADKIAKAESELGSALSYIGEIESEIFKLRNKYANVEERQGFRHIIAPQDAHVVNAMVSGIGETVKEGEAVVSILPANRDMAVAVYIDPIDVPLIDVGSPVRLQFEGWPAVVFSGWPNTAYGTFGGQVAVINDVATDAGKFRVLVVPDTEDKDWPEQIRVGSGALGWMMLKDVPIWFEIWRQLNGFPPEYTGELKEEETFEKELRYYKEDEKTGSKTKP